MFRTEHGDFNGDTWEDFAKSCLVLKYEDEGYQALPAWQGDYGIEGFTRTGLAFQCYCPDTNYDPKTLYEKQRDKITEDLGKLEKNRVGLASVLSDVKLKKWIFLTPEYRNKELVGHCQTKAKEVRNKDLSFLDPSFDVVIHEMDSLAAQIPIVRGMKGQKILVMPKDATTTSEIANWRIQQIELVENAVRKHGHRVPVSSQKREDKINRLTQFSIQNFLDGNNLLGKWRENYPDDYDKFILVTTDFERSVEERCITFSGESNSLYNEIRLDLEKKLTESFPHLEAVMIGRLTEQVVAGWILRCPINFE